jgi:hypothetical protein
MQYKIIVALAIVFTLPSYAAEELERGTITSCAYQAGTAREIQAIRQTEGDDWAEFEQKINMIYADGQGRTDLLAIAKRVYRHPTQLSPTEVHKDMFDACVERVKGTEPTA